MKNKRTWNRYLDSQLYSECQMVTALNAYYYLYGKQYCKQGGKEYEELVDKCCARHGSALDIHKIHKLLKIKVSKRFLSFYGVLKDTESLKFKKNGIEHHRASKLDPLKKSRIQLPLEVSTWDRINYGNHSCLIVDYNKRAHIVRIANFRKITHNGWIFADDLEDFYIPSYTSGDRGLNGDGQQWHYRLFMKDEK